MASTRQRRTRIAVAALVALGTAGVSAGWALAPNAQAADGCLVDYTTNQWTGGYTAAVKLTAGTALSNWTVTWTYPGDQKITSAWNATVTQTGTAVTAVNTVSNGAVAAGASTEFGVQGTFASSNAAPADFAVNGVACNGAAQPTTAPTTSEPTSEPTSSPTGSPTAAPTTSAPTPDADCGTAVFCDGFETQTGTAPSGAWTVTAADCTGTGTATIDSTVAYSGTKSVKITGTAGYCNHVFVQATQDLSTVGALRYGRFYVQHTTPLPAAHITFMAQKDAADNNTDLRMGGQNGALQWNRQSDDATLPEQSPNGVALSQPLAVNVWNCVEFMVNGGTGEMSTWIDGVEVPGLHLDATPTQDIDSQWNNKVWRPNLIDLRLGWESYGDGADTLWYDDVAIGTSRIGC